MEGKGWRKSEKGGGRNGRKRREEGRERWRGIWVKVKRRERHMEGGGVMMEGGWRKGEKGGRDGKGRLRRGIKVEGGWEEE